MEAPKKLYVSDYGSETMYNWHPERSAVKDIEYIRKDALIEKACDAYCKVCGHFAHSVPTHICRHDCEYFSDFKNYMEG